VRLHEQHRPATLDELVGQDKAVRMVRGIEKRGGFGGASVWITGQSGTGKTTLARIVAGTMADDWMIQEYDSGDAVGAGTLDDIETSMGLCAPGKGGRVWIINEAHGLRKPIIRRLLGIMERLPKHCALIFTTTWDGEARFEDDIDAAPFASRCLAIRLTNQGLAQAFAERCLSIAQAEGLDGQPIEAYVKLARKCGNNCRAMLGEIEAGAMIPD